MIQYAFKKKCSEQITYSEPILEKGSIGQKPRFWQRKNPENQWFSGLFGGDKRDRTADLLNAIQALSQLSYTPIFGSLSDSFCIIAQLLDLSIGNLQYFEKIFIALGGCIPSVNMI